MTATPLGTLPTQTYNYSPTPVASFALCKLPQCLQSVRRKKDVFKNNLNFDKQQYCVRQKENADCTSGSQSQAVFREVVNHADLDKSVQTIPKTIITQSQKRCCLVCELAPLPCFHLRVFNNLKVTRNCSSCLLSAMV